ncbi:MAG TPA: DUF4252 domain-containing protein [Bacteroidales bacterium]|jgi:hypothetical protein|nr:DUF4252 domain-containing protein [Bacteroidales bacterium]
MKKLLVLFTVFCLTAALRAQNNAVDEMFRKYQEREGFSVITISSGLFRMIANLDTDNEDADNIIHNLRSIRILSVKDSLLNKGLNFYNELTKKLNISAYEELMVVKEGQDVTKFLVKHNGDRISELLVIAGGPGGNSLISIQGNLSLKNISELSKTEMEGLNKLEKIEKKE